MGLDGLVDDDLDAQALVTTAIRCHRELDRARVEGDVDRLAPFVSPGLLTALAELWRGRSRGFGPASLRAPRVRLVTLVNAYDSALAWCTAEVHADGVSPVTGRLRDRRRPEYWTFRRHQDRWKLSAIDSPHDAERKLHAPSVLERADDPALRSQAVFELAAADAAPDRPADAGLISSSAQDAGQALRDLSLVDERFSWHVLTHVIERVLAAWTAAAELGTEAPLLAFAEPACARDLLSASNPDPRHGLRDFELLEAGPLVVRELPAPSRTSVRVLVRAHPTRRARWGRGGREQVAARWILRLDPRRPGGWCLERVTIAPR